MITDSKNASVAKLLATENITVVQDNVPTASFDVKNRVLTLPLWADLDADVQSLLVGHEVGHALYTPEEGWHEAVCSRGGNYKSFLNVVEDARIEKLVQRKYPGLRREFVSGYQSLMAKGFFGPKDAAEFGLIDRINTHFKCGMTANIQFADDEVQWVERISKLETWEQVVEVTDELFEFCKQQEEQKKQEEQRREEEAESAESEEGEGDSENNSDGHGSSMEEEEDFDEDGSEEDPEDSEDGDSGSTHGSSDEEEDSSDEDEGSSDEGEEGADETSADDEGSDEEYDEEFGNQGGTDGGQSQDEEDGPRSETDEALRDSIEREYAGDASRIDVINVEVRADDHERYFMGYKELLETIKKEIDDDSYFEKTLESGELVYDEWYQSARRSISLMVKDFEMKKSATRLARTRISRSGSLDTLKMNNYRCTDDIFKKIKSTPKGKNHGFVMVLDLSGSMCDVLGDVVKQTMLLAHFCRRINVPFRVYGFTDYLWSRDMKDNPAPLPDELNVSRPDKRLRMIEIFNEKMSKSDMLYMCKALTGSSCSRYGARLRVFGLGGTPLDSAIVALIPKIQEFQAAHRLDIMNTIFLTDGASHSMNFATADDAEGYSQKRGLNELVDSRRISYQPKTYATLRYGKRVYNLGEFDTTTAALMTALKDATGSSILGYYVFAGRGRGDGMGIQRRFGVNRDTAEENWKKMKKGFHVTVTEQGYDEMYLVWQKNMRVTKSTMEVNAGATKGALKKAFAATSSNSKQARALLLDIVKRVA